MNAAHKDVTNDWAFDTTNKDAMESWNKYIGIDIDEISMQPMAIDTKAATVDSGPAPSPVYKSYNPGGTEAIDRWLAQQGRMKNGTKVIIYCAIAVAILFTILSFMVTNADAGMAFMKFTVTEVNATIITVVDEHGDGFTFYKEGSPEVQIGQEVVVCTDITYVGEDQWEWNRKRTAIIDKE